MKFENISDQFIKDWPSVTGSEETSERSLNFLRDVNAYKSLGRYNYELTPDTFKIVIKFELLEDATYFKLRYG